MVIAVEDIIRDVSIAIDNNRTDEPLFDIDDEDALTLDEIIRSKLTDAAKAVEMEAPIRLLEGGHDFSDGDMYINRDGKGYVCLPHDFMRLIAFRMTDWERTVHAAITESDHLYPRQSSKFKGICGSPEKPICVLVRKSGGKCLEFYSCDDDTAHIDQALYLPYPEIDPDGGIDIPELCYPAVVYRAAFLSLSSLGNTELSKVMLELSKYALQ